VSAIKKIGFIGIGNMGNPMAGHLVKQGFDVTVYDVRPEALTAFISQHGGRAAASLVDAAHGMDAVITMLPDDKVVRTAVLGDGSENCVAAGLARGAIVMDMSTCNPTATRSLAEALKPLLAAIGRNIIPCGGTGTAHAMKALANYINACALINAVEAMTIGKRFGLDAKLMAEALIPMCAGRNHPIEKKVIPHILTRKFGTGMAMGFIAKDVKIAVETAKSIGAIVPLGERVSELWSAAVEKLGYDLDQTQVARYWEDASGVKL